MTVGAVAASDAAEQWWSTRGAGTAPALVDANAIVVVGDDPVSAAHAALGLARAESVSRRVAVADLVGDVGPLAALVDGEDPHGVVDSFLYGISLTRVAQKIDATGNLFVLPSGTEPVLTEEIFRSERWSRLAAGFREAGALLILVAPATAPGLDDLVAMLDGAVLVGDAVVGVSVHVLAVVPPPPLEQPADVALREPRAGRGSGVKKMPRDNSSPPWLTPVLLGTVLVGLGGAYLRSRGVGGGAQPGAAAVGAPVVLAPPVPAPTLPPRDSTPMALTIENPADSAYAAAYAVAILLANTPDAAEHELDARARGLPAATVSPVVYPDNVQWYRVYAGAYTDRARADSLRVSIEKQPSSTPGSVSVVRAPFALLIERSVRADSVSIKRGGYLARGARPYALLQPDGTVNLYAGAFERPEQAAVLGDSLRARGLAPVLVYRTGTPL